MKGMTCKQLGGACDHVFHADSFDEMAVLSKKHAMEMIERGDEDHVTAMTHMRVMMSSSKGMADWMERKRREFDELPHL